MVELVIVMREPLPASIPAEVFEIRVLLMLTAAVPLLVSTLMPVKPQSEIVESSTVSSVDPLLLEMMQYPAILKIRTFSRCTAAAAGYPTPVVPIFPPPLIERFRSVMTSLDPAFTVTPVLAAGTRIDPSVPT